MIIFMKEKKKSFFQIYFFPNYISLKYVTYVKYVKYVLKKMVGQPFIF